MVGIGFAPDHTLRRPALDLTGVLIGFVATAVMAVVALVVVVVIAKRHPGALPVSVLGLGILGLLPLFYVLTRIYYHVHPTYTMSAWPDVIAWSVLALCWGGAAALVIRAVRHDAESSVDPSSVDGALAPRAPQDPSGDRP